MSALDPLNNVVAWVIIRLHTVLGHLFGPNTGLAWGLSIVILVVAIRILLVPLFVKQVHAQRKMAQHAPYLQELRKKYKGDKQKLNEETMKFYKENGVNPLAGCLPMIPQMIVFFALFSVLRSIATWKTGQTLHYGLTISVVKSAQAATIFGVHLGSKLLFAHPAPTPRVAIVIALSVLISAGTTFLTVRQTSKRGLMQTNVDPDNPMAQSQKYMMYVVPFFSLTGLYWQYGLVLYWVTTNMWTLGQQYIMFRNWTVEPTGAASATAAASTATPASRAASAPRTRPATARPAANGAATARSAANGAATARPAANGKRTGTASNGTASNGSAGNGRTGVANGRASSAAQVKRAGAPGASGSSGASGFAASSESPGASGFAASSESEGKPSSSRSRPAGASNGSGGPKTPATPRRPAINVASAPPAANGGEKRGLPGLLRLGRSKPEPEPEPEVPATRVVRQQPTRQAKSKRSGKR